jgi:hypothetical protein
LNVSVILCALLLIMTPKPALAWFGWIDSLSGPGHFLGEEYEFRVWCFGRASTGVTNLQADLNEAVRLTLMLREDPVPTSETSAQVKPKISEQAMKDAANAWTLFLGELDRSNMGFPVQDPQKFKAFRDSISKLTQSLSPQLVKPPDTAQTPRPDQSQGQSGLALALALAAVRNAEQGNMFIDEIYKANIAESSIGTFWTFCSSPDKRRRVALEFGATIWNADGSPDFAHNYNIRLITLMPSLSFRVLRDPRHDFVDGGFSAGLYRFSSGGFNTFTGKVLEPYLDLHGPTAWVNVGCYKELLALLTLRVGAIGFPGGFDTGPQFGAATTTHISGNHWTPTLTLFYNVPPLVRRLNSKTAY